LVFSTIKKISFWKKNAHTKFKFSGKAIDYNQFSNLRAQCKKRSKIDYTNYLSSVQNSIKHNPSNFWKYFKNQKSLSLPNSMHLNNIYSVDANVIVNLFANHFSSVYKSHSIPNNIYYPTTSINSLIPQINFPKTLNSTLSSCHISLSEVFESLNSLRDTTCPGPDLISRIFFMRCKYVIAPPLCYIFNLSLDSGVFPDYWKSSLISPIHKGLDPSNILNYRPVSLLSILPKLFEELVSKKIIPILNSCIINEQHGFISSRSTTTNLLILTEDLFNALSSGDQVDVIYTDFSKAFDTINHKILHSKLRSYGICDPLLSWLYSYCTDRIQFVKYKNFYSESFRVSSGVPQGSHLAPILFLLYINDITLPHSKMLLFADDLKMYRIIKSNHDYDLLQSDLNSLSNWCKLNNLSLNASKCKYMSYTRSRSFIASIYNIDGVQLEQVQVIKDLGVLFDKKLTFNNHVTFIKNKAMKLVGFIKSCCKHFKDMHALRLVYCSYIRSNLEYCSLIWSPYLKGQIKSLEAVQHAFLRFLCFNCHIPREPHTDYDPILTTLNLDSLETRRIKLDLNFLYNVLNNKVDCPEFLQKLNFYVPAYATRSNTIFFTLRQKSYYACNTPSTRVMKFLNVLNIDIFACNSLESFKHHVSFALR